MLIATENSRWKYQPLPGQIPRPQCMSAHYVVEVNDIASIQDNFLAQRLVKGDRAL